MKKYEIVKQNREFNSIIESKKAKKNKYFVVYYQKNQLNQARFGVSVGKKIGHAVTRNKLKRQVRSIVDKNKKYYSKSLDYIIMVRKTCLLISFEEMTKFLDQLMKEISMKEK